MTTYPICLLEILFRVGFNIPYPPSPFLRAVTTNPLTRCGRWWCVAKRQKQPVNHEGNGSTRRTKGDVVIIYCNTNQLRVKGTVWPDWICTRVEPLDRP
jgi:hypothetical protein